MPSNRASTASTIDCGEDAPRSSTSGFTAFPPPRSRLVLPDPSSAHPPLSGSPGSRSHSGSSHSSSCLCLDFPLLPLDLPRPSPAPAITSCSECSLLYSRDSFLSILCIVAASSRPPNPRGEAGSPPRDAPSDPADADPARENLMLGADADPNRPNLRPVSPASCAPFAPQLPGESPEMPFSVRWTVWRSKASCLAMSSTADTALFPPSASTISNVALRCVYAFSWCRMTVSNACPTQPPPLVNHPPPPHPHTHLGVSPPSRARPYRRRGSSVP
eukprot:1959450-Rhodomonas_salina.4